MRAECRIETAPNTRWWILVAKSNSRQDQQSGHFQIRGRRQRQSQKKSGNLVSNRRGQRVDAHTERHFSFVKDDKIKQIRRSLKVVTSSTRNIELLNGNRSLGVTDKRNSMPSKLSAARGFKFADLPAAPPADLFSRS